MILHIVPVYASCSNITIAEYVYLPSYQCKYAPILVGYAGIYMLRYITHTEVLLE